MAARLDHTSEGMGEGIPNYDSEDAMDFVEILKSSLRTQKLIYIAEIVKEVEDETLSDLMEYSRKDLCELLAEIHDNKDNEYKIKVSHRNKFAKIVCEFGVKRAQSLIDQQTAASTKYSTPSNEPSQVKLLFLGQEEEKAIESIQSGQSFMEQNLIKMKQLLNDLEENNENTKEELETICDSLKQQIDAKQTEITTSIDRLYQYHLNNLKQRKQITTQSAKVVAKVCRIFFSFLCQYIDNSSSHNICYIHIMSSFIMIIKAILQIINLQNLIEKIN